MYNLTLVRKNGSGYIDSREVALLIGKRHDHLLRDIAVYRITLEKITAPNFGGCDFFVESTYVDVSGRERPCYLLTKMGCEIVANKLTGEKGIIFTAAYVYKFNEMETERGVAPTIQPEQLGEYNKTANMIVHFMRKIGATPMRILSFLKKFYEPLGIEVEDEVFPDTSHLYTAKKIATKLGIYSLYGKPHAHAVSCILNENMRIGDEHRTVLTAGFDDFIVVSVRYDDYAVEALRNWLKANGYPGVVDGFYRNYYIRHRGI